MGGQLVIKSAQHTSLSLVTRFVVRKQLSEVAIDCFDHLPKPLEQSFDRLWCLGFHVLALGRQ